MITEEPYSSTEPLLIKGVQHLVAQQSAKSCRVSDQMFETAMWTWTPRKESMEHERQVGVCGSKPCSGPVQVAFHPCHWPLQLSPAIYREGLTVAVQDIWKQLKLGPLLTLPGRGTPTVAGNAPTGRLEFYIPNRGSVDVDQVVRADSQIREADFAMRPNRTANRSSSRREKLDHWRAQSVLGRSQTPLKHRCDGSTEARNCCLKRGAIRLGRAPRTGHFGRVAGAGAPSHAPSSGPG